MLVGELVGALSPVNHRGLHQGYSYLCLLHNKQLIFPLHQYMLARVENERCFAQSVHFSYCRRWIFGWSLLWPKVTEQNDPERLPGRLHSSVVEGSNTWWEGRGFDSRQEQRDNFLSESFFSFFVLFLFLCWLLYLCIPTVRMHTLACCAGILEHFPLRNEVIQHHLILQIIA